MMSSQFKIFDFHAHYDDERFSDCRDEILRSMPENNVVGIINCGSDIASSEHSVGLAEKYDFIYAAVGYHPESVKQDTVFNEETLCGLLHHKKVVAVGEVGLDYYWDKTYKERQIDFFEKQLKIADEFSLPVIIHDRDAHADTLDILKKHRPRGVVHCFSGSLPMAEEIINLGMYIGIGGVVTFKNSKKLCEIVKNIPLDKILLETDAPYMSPEPFRGKTNLSHYIKFVAKKIAEIKDTTEQQVLDMALKNAITLFNLK